MSTTARWDDQLEAYIQRLEVITKPELRVRGSGQEAVEPMLRALLALRDAAVDGDELMQGHESDRLIVHLRVFLRAGIRRLDVAIDMVARLMELGIEYGDDPMVQRYAERVGGKAMMATVPARTAAELYRNVRGAPAAGGKSDA